MSLNIVLNGDAKSLEQADLTVLLAELELTGKRYAVEINQQVIPRADHAQYQLKDGDSVEIIHAIGGG